jgi:hypothetical protein
LKIAFKIPPHTEDVSPLHLIAEAGGDEISFLIFEKYPFTLHGFYTFNFDKNLSADDLLKTVRSIFESENIFNSNFTSKHLFYNFKEMTPVPENYFLNGENENILGLMYGNDKRKISFDDSMQNEKVKIAYRVPKNIHEYFSTHFSSEAKHAVSAINNTESGNVLDCVIYHSTIRVTLFKEDQLQFIQYFDYTAPADVVYYLLSVCKQFDTPPDDTKLLLSGMVAKTSALYEEIYKYFLQTSFRELPKNVFLTGKVKDHPNHFYTHLTALAQCV